MISLELNIGDAAKAGSPSIVRRTCSAFVEGPDCLAHTHIDRVDDFLHSIDKTHYAKILKKESVQMTFPLKFDSQHQKLNFFSILHLLNFGSGYRVILKASNGSGAFDNIVKLLISAHVSGGNLNAAWMRNINANTVSEMMRISMIVEVPVENNPILKEMKPSPAAPVIHKITGALNSTGKALESLGKYNFLIDFIQASIKESDDVDQCLDKIARLPALCDRIEVNGEMVCIYKKVQVMLHELLRNGLQAQCIRPGDLTIFADNVIPTMLRHYGLISCPSADIALASDLEITDTQAISLRAASIVICEKIFNRARHLGMGDWIGSEVDLDNYLWKIAKEGDLRALPRYVDRSTWFY